MIEVSDRLTVESCIDGGSLEMAIHFHDVMPANDGLLPLMAIGYRKTELCAMPIILLTQSERWIYTRTADEVILSTMMETMTPLADE